MKVAVRKAAAKCYKPCRD